MRIDISINKTKFAASNHPSLTHHNLSPMWLLNENSQTAETTSLSPWTVEQQKSQWCGNAAEFGNGMNYEQQMRSIIPPAFRNSNAKVIWSDPPKSLEANINEALGITPQNWQTPNSNQLTDQDSSSGIVYFQVHRIGFNQYPFIVCVRCSNQFQNANFMNGLSMGWGQTELDEPRGWDLNIPMSVCQPGLRNNLSSASSLQTKWLSSEDHPSNAWNTAPNPAMNPNIQQRPPTLNCPPPPPPNYLNPMNNEWQQNARGRGSMYLPSLPQTTFNAPSFDSAAANNWNAPSTPLISQRSINNPPIMPHTISSPNMPPQRSRLQNIWSHNTPINNTASSMCIPPPNLDYGSNLPQWTQSNSLSMGEIASKQQQFMGENAMWQDPNGEVRKWQRDTGTAIWGDPEKQPTEIHRWLVPPGAEYESSEDTTANDDPNSPQDSKSSSNTKTTGRVIVPLGWGDVKVTAAPATAPANAAPTAVSSSVHSVNSSASLINSTVDNRNWPNTIPMLNHNAATGWDRRGGMMKGAMNSGAGTNGWDSLSMGEGEWNGAFGLGASSITSSASLQQPSLIDLSLLSKPLPHETLSLMNTLLLRLPVLDQAEHQFANLIASVKQNAKNGDSTICDTTLSPNSLLNMMTVEQRAEHDRLIIEIAATKTDIAAIREKINATQQVVNNKPLVTSNEHVMTSAPRFGDSILDATAGVEPQKPLFSIF
ncbi:unnamed protein product [Anisakis simplex]|uniref:M_domain domain-containing protein n=1 Tax=Anisakis simplex TaxID=6269 RepID=A0A0M3K3Y7_ANISI|nr:unnamed protein product [Anisakis simplex]